MFWELWSAMVPEIRDSRVGGTTIEALGLRTNERKMDESCR